MWLRTDGAPSYSSHLGCLPVEGRGLWRPPPCASALEPRLATCGWTEALEGRPWLRTTPQPSPARGQYAGTVTLPSLDGAAWQERRGHCSSHTCHTPSSPQGTGRGFWEGGRAQGGRGVVPPAPFPEGPGFREMSGKWPPMRAVHHARAAAKVPILPLQAPGCTRCCQSPRAAPGPSCRWLA